MDWDWGTILAAFAGGSLVAILQWNPARYDRRIKKLEGDIESLRERMRARGLL